MTVISLKDQIAQTAAQAAEKPVEKPHNFEAEASLLGLLLVENKYYERVNEILQPDFFYEPLHQRLYEAMSKLIERGQIASPISLKNMFDKDPALADIGGAKYLMQLSTMAVHINDPKDLALQVHDLAMRRKLIEIAENVMTDAYKHETEDSAINQIERAEQELFSLTSVGDITKSFTPLSTPLKEALGMAESAMKRTRRVVGVTTGFTDLDNILGGLNNSDLLILAGRPSMGKTALAVNIAYNAAKELHDEKSGCIGVFSLEMSSAQISMRILSMGTGINSNDIRMGHITDDKFGDLVSRCREINELPMFIDDTPALSISAIRTRARRLKRQHNLKVLVIDYLQLLRGSSKRSNENRVQEISEITQGLKAIAKELNIPVIALSQLSRAVELRPDKRPQLSDLRESGSIEQDADVVMFIYREEYYLMRGEPPVEDQEKHSKWQEDMERCRNITEVGIAKQRNGPVGRVKLRFDGATTMFQNLAIEFGEGE
jgi:replicative DNA helicase